jgi:hypothetical protein
MGDLVDRLRENIVADAFADGRIVGGVLAERLIRERLDAVDEIDRLRAALITWRNAFETGRNDPLHIAYENGNAALGVPVEQSAAESAAVRKATPAP